MNSPASEPSSATSPPPAVTFATAVAFWFKLGCISFGGPAGQIAIMHTELVERRRWISERRFMHALNYCMVLPGPEAQQLATYIGWLLHGTKGGLVAGLLFVLPSLALLMGLSAIYVAWGDLPWIAAALNGIKPAVVAIVLVALLRIGGRAIKNGILLAFAIAAFVALAKFKVPFPWIVLAAGILGWLGGRVWPAAFAAGGHGSGKKKDAPHVPSVIDDHDPPPKHAEFRWSRLILQTFVGFVCWLLPMVALVGCYGWESTFTRMGWFFTTSALVTFGGAYAVLPYVAEQTVNVFGWLKPGQMIDGHALGETTPGPLIMVVSFVGFVGGWQAGEMGWLGAILGCLIATYFTFLPSFVFIFAGGPFIEQMRGELRITSALTGITAAVVGVILNLLLFFAQTVFVPDFAQLSSTGLTFTNIITAIDWLSVGIAVASFVAMSRYKVGLPQLVAATAFVGWLRLVAGSWLVGA